MRNGWGEPEALEAVNTPYDEIMPYFDPVSNDLYFASTGHKSIGGFDVFKSHYDVDRDAWSAPVSLGFPVNSPDNEYLAMPGPGLGTLLLITDRQGLDSMMLVYILQMKEPKQSLASASPEEIRRIGKLGGIESLSSIIDVRKEPVTAATPANEKNTGTLPSKKEISGMPDHYQDNIRMALKYQVTADSLSRLAREARIRVREMPNPDERWAWQRKIIAWEKEADDNQNMANDLYAQVKKMEQGGTTESIPPAIQKDTVINAITLYTYTKKDPASGREVKAQPSDEPAAIKPDALQASGEPGHRVTPPEKNEAPENRFVVLDKSPYNAGNPFPLDMEIPRGTFYRIQLGVFGSTVSDDHFGGLSPITAETVPGKSLTRYYAGKFTRYDEARQALEKVRQAGFKDAFIVGWYDRQKMPVSRILELEKRDSTQTRN